MGRRLTFLFAFSVIAMMAAPVIAYEILLDIDHDGQPTTIVTTTDLTSIEVRVVLQPTVAEEVITLVEFGLGGSCLECVGVHEYGTGHDLGNFGMYADWTSVLELGVPGDGIAMNGILLLDCGGNPGYHTIFRAEATAGSFVLHEAMFIATFNAWVADPPAAGCEVVPSNLAAFDTGSGDFWNFLEIGGPAPIPALQETWGTIRCLYR